MSYSTDVGVAKEISAPPAGTRPDLLVSVMVALAYAYVFSAPWDPLQTGLGTPATVVGAAFISVWLFSFVTGRIDGRLSRGPVSVLVALVVWTSLTVLWSANSSVTASVAVSTLALALSAIAIAEVFASRTQSAILTIALGSIPLSIALAVSADKIALSGRASFAGIDENYAAFTLSLGLAAALFVAVTRFYGKSWRILLSAAIIPLVFGILSTGSRTGLITVVALAIVALVVASRSLVTLIFAACATVLGLLTFLYLADSGLLPPRLQSFLETFTAPGDDRDLIVATFQATQDSWLLKGVGAGADADYLSAVANWPVNAHSMFWATWIELGLVGLLIWFALLSILAVLAWHSPFRTFFVLAAVPFLLFAYSLGTVRSNLMWAIFGLILVGALQQGASQIGRIPSRGTRSG